MSPGDPHPEFQDGARPNMEGLLGREDFRAGARVLAGMGMSFEAWLYFPQLPELADFAKAVPDLSIILNHIGGLMRVGPYGRNVDEVLATWRSGIAAVAECPNVNVKLGWIGMPRTGFDWHERDVPIGSEELADSMAPFMNYCIEQFGPDRGMFESNFPVDKVAYSYKRDVQRLQAPVQRLHSLRARGAVPRHRGARVPRRCLTVIGHSRAAQGNYAEPFLRYKTDPVSANRPQLQVLGVRRRRNRTVDQCVRPVRDQHSPA